MKNDSTQIPTTTSINFNKCEMQTLLIAVVKTDSLHTIFNFESPSKFSHLFFNAAVILLYSDISTHLK